jgi:hypothetical protein
LPAILLLKSLFFIRSDPRCKHLRALARQFAGKDSGRNSDIARGLIKTVRFAFVSNLY